MYGNVFGVVVVSVLLCSVTLSDFYFKWYQRPR